MSWMTYLMFIGVRILWYYELIRVNPGLSVAETYDRINIFNED